MLKPPNENEFASFQKKYIDTVSGDVFETLKQQQEDFSEFIDALSPEQLDFRYAENKWSIRELIVHIVDTEIIFNYRALAISRGEKQVLPGFEQDAYLSFAKIEHLDKEYLLNYFMITRYASLILFKGFTDEQWDLTGKVSEYEMSLRSFPYMLAGHLNHHVSILNERYLE